MRNLGLSILHLFIIIQLGLRANTTLLATSTKASLEYSPTLLLSCPNPTPSKSLTPITFSTANPPIHAPTAHRNSR